MKPFTLFITTLLISFLLCFQVPEATADEFADTFKAYNEKIAAGEIRDAIPLAEKAYELGKRKYGETSIEIGTLALNLGTVKNRIGEFKAAKPFLEEAMENFGAHYGPDGIEMLDVNMELTLNAIGQSEEGSTKAYYKNVERIVGKRFGENSPMMASLALELANFSYTHSVYQSLDLYKKALKYSELAYPEGHYLVGYAAFGLGKIYMGSGSGVWKKAEENLLYALENFDKTPPPNIENVIVAHGLLTQLYSEAGKSEQATRHCVAVGTLRGDHDLNEYKPLYKKVAQYPRSAYDRDQEGVVIVEYTVSPEGRVVNPMIVESTSKSFSKAVLDVVEEWRYAPRVVDGAPVATPGVKTRVNFQIDD